MKTQFTAPKALIFLLILAAALLPFGAVRAQDNPINVVTTIGMIADVVQVIGGDHVAVTALMGPGVDPHLYTATEGDVETLLDADIIFYGGLHLEARMTDIFEQISEMKPAIAVSESIPDEDRLTAPGLDDVPDPHVWMDVELWAIAAGAIRDGLSEYDPDHADDYAANAEAYLEELTKLDEYAQEQINRIPTRQRVLVTAHDAFQYFSRAYGIEVHAPQGITTASEAGIEDIRNIVTLLVEREIPAIFVESSVPPDVVEAIVEGAKAQGHEVVIGGSLFSDALGEAGTFEGTYIGMITHNVDTIVSALLGESKE